MTAMVSWACHMVGLGWERRSVNEVLGRNTGGDCVVMDLWMYECMNVRMDLNRLTDGG